MTTISTNSLTPQGQEALRELLQVWFDFERRLDRVPILQRLQRGTFSLDDYQNLLLNLRQQVIEGSRWITRCASSFDRDYAEMRSMVIGHAQEEHRDYQYLEEDYVASGGDREAILSRAKNPGSEALHGYLMYQASLPNPVALLGAMWIIEGLGEKMASDWAKKIHQAIPGSEVFTKFISYHGENDDAHMAKLYQMLDDVCQGEGNLDAIKQVAKTVGRLYALQLAEIDELEL